jgi:hypothetical protein
MDLFLKIHGFEILSDEKISVDVEAVVIDGNVTVANQPVDFLMNDKSHRLATLTDGKLRAELIFPVTSNGIQHLDANSNNASCRMEIVPSNISFNEPGNQPLLLEDVLSGKRSISRGDVFTIAKGFYDVKGDIKIDRGGILIIQAGTTLEFDEHAGIICEGVLHAIGTVKENITFTAWRSH